MFTLPAVAVLLTPSQTKAIGEVLVSYAEKVHASAIVMGKSDRSALQELFIGSVAKVRSALHALRVC